MRLTLITFLKKLRKSFFKRANRFAISQNPSLIRPAGPLSKHSSSSYIFLLSIDRPAISLLASISLAFLFNHSFFIVL